MIGNFYLFTFFYSFSNGRYCFASYMPQGTPLNPIKAKFFLGAVG
jgi:hypothetical protein